MRYPFDIVQVLQDRKPACQADVCSVIKAIKQLGSEWRLIVTYYLLDKPLRFNDLLKKGEADDLNSRTLSRTLKYLQRAGIIRREVVNTQPFSVSYSLTDKGRDLAEVLGAYRRWGEKWNSLKSPAIQARSSSRQWLTSSHMSNRAL